MLMWEIFVFNNQIFFIFLIHLDQLSIKARAGGEIFKALLLRIKSICNVK